MSKAKVELIEDVDRMSVGIVYYTGRNNLYYPYEQMVERIEVTQDDSNSDRFDYRLKVSDTDTLARWHSREQACGYVTEEAIVKAERAVKKLHKQHKALILQGRETWQYKAITAPDMPKPQHYETDLTEHDAYAFAKYDPDMFLWTVRPCGTWLVLPEWANGDFQQVCVKQREDLQRFYLVTKDKVREMTAQQWGAYELKA